MIQMRTFTIVFPLVASGSEGAVCNVEIVIQGLSLKMCQRLLALPSMRILKSGWLRSFPQ